MSTGMRTLGQLARTAGLARASLLHYEERGLLAPAARSAAGYRLYGEPEFQRLRAIRQYREAGLSLAAIGQLLAPRALGRGTKAAGPSALLEARLVELNREARRVRAQQMALARLLAAEVQAGQEIPGKAGWVALLRRAGFSDRDMRDWHAGFEADSPARHAAFLRSLGLTRGEMEAIQRWSKARRKSAR